ncbi:RNA-splicing factor [Diaporthe eres]|uniref:RNA-splicing factor n=1 Tax=Diaporthe eres TaxID=83184 RepID=A0ABR1PQB4_DIAER
MGGNDLNLKKSWHPQLMTNQRRVYDAEQAALQERKLTEARLEEIRRERQIEETQKQLEAAGGQKKVDRVEWMYQGPNDGGRDEYSSEAFLLGKRRIDSVLRGDDMKKVEKTAGPTGETPGPVPVIASARDTAAKIREDPLVAIKRQEQGAYQAMMKDPSKPRRPENRDDEEERARKLAAMQNDATDLDRAREARLAALAEKEQAEREADDRARANSSKYGGREFAHKLHNAAGNGSLADRIGRGRQGFQRDDD